MSRATRIGSALAGLVLATGMMVGASPAQAQPVSRFIRIVDSDFTPPTQKGNPGDTFVFFLDQNSQIAHTVTSDTGIFDLTFEQSRVQGVPLDTPGRYQYYCKNHGGPGLVGMSGVIVVNDPNATTTTTLPTTTTTAPTTTTTEPTTTTTATTTPPTSATTTPTTRPATTSTTRPPTTTAPTSATTATTAPKPSVQGASQPTTATTKKKSTTTTAKKKTPTTVKAEETTTTVSLLPSLAAALPSGAGEVPAASSEDLPDATESGEEAASWVRREEGGKGGGGMKLLFGGLGGLGALGLGGAAWGWYHRSSRYMPA